LTEPTDKFGWLREGDDLAPDGGATWYQDQVPDAIDPLLLGQRVVAILETGVRVATYKLATLMALIDHCIENLPEHPTEPLVVPIPDRAHRVMELYWRQVRPFEGQLLRQSSGERERIPRAVRALRAASGASSLSVAMTMAPDVYRSSIDEIGLCLAQQPLYRLQRLPGSEASEPFLYDDSFLHSNVSRRTLRDHNDAIVLMPGVATGLARLAGLLKPALEIMWVDDVRRLNKFLSADVPDIAGICSVATAPRWPRYEDRSKRPSARTASTARPTCLRTTRSTMCCRGRWSASTVWPTWSWRARAATLTSAMRCRQFASWTEC